MVIPFIYTTADSGLTYTYTALVITPLDVERVCISRDTTLVSGRRVETKWGRDGSETCDVEVTTW